MEHPIKIAVTLFIVMAFIAYYTIGTRWAKLAMATYIASGAFVLLSIIWLGDPQ